MSISIENELANCRQSAEEGYELAKQEFDDIKQTLRNAETSLSETDREQNQITRIQNTKLIDEQRQELRRLKAVIDPISDDLQKLREHSKDFSIVVYGRTMAGKSTLMEILTHGNGKSIGTGSQRTTLDVRNYYWNGLKITDVPGISAFGGAVDEEVALEAAKAADLIIFLLTSDAPQADEAEKLAQLRSLGKPVLGIINVKMSFNIGDELDLEDLKDRLADTETIDITLQQFKNFSAKHNQDWSNIKFVPTHLLSAYQSQDKNPEVFKISRFTEVEDFILEKVRDDGRFLRIKTFADIVAVPMNNIILKIYEQAGKTLLESDIYFNKLQQLNEWREKFLARSEERMENLYEQLVNQLNNAIFNFAQNNYENEKVGEDWEKTFKELHFDKQYETLLKDLAAECERKRKELSDELSQEISFNFSGDGTSMSVELASTTPWEKYASLILPNLLMFVPGIGWGARIAIGIGSVLLDWFFGKSKEEKIKEAQDKLCEDLTPPSMEILGKMHESVADTYNNEILGKGVDEFANMLAEYGFMLARLGKNQGDMAHALFKEYEDLNFRLLNEAIEYRNAGRIRNFEALARVPGEKMTVFADGRSLNTAKLSDLLGESVTVMTPKKDANETIKSVLNRNFDVEGYPLDWKKEDQEIEQTYACTLKDDVDITSYKIAQQVAGIPIIMKNPPSTKKATAQSSNAYNDAPPNFEQVENLLSNPAKNKNAIANILKILEETAESQKDASAMNQIAAYYREISQFGDALRCKKLAKTFTQQNSNSDNNDNATFEQVENLLSNPAKNKNAIANILKILEETAESQKDAAAMNKIAEYYSAIRQYKDAARCSELAETFAQQNSASDDDEFRAGFEQIENLLSNPGKNKNAIANILKTLEKTAESKRNADAMNQIADYYSAIRQFKDAARCSELAENF